MSQSKPGPFLKRFFIPDTHIERLALERLESLGLMPTSPAPVAVEKYCERRWGWPEDYVDLPPGILGAAAFTESGLVKVAVSRELAEDTSRTGRVRTRSSLAHEIGHGELHEDKFIEKLRHDREQLDFFSVGPEEPGRIRLLCREEQMRRPRRDEWWETPSTAIFASLDTTFGGTGKVTTTIGTGDDFRYGYGVAIQSHDGKIVVAGHSFNGVNRDIAVVRYNIDGTLDLTFNGAGYVTTDFGLGDDDSRSVVIQNDGKIVVVGSAFTGTGLDFAVVRYNTNGSLDTTFNGTGKVTTCGKSRNNTHCGHPLPLKRQLSVWDFCGRATMPAPGPRPGGLPPPPRRPPAGHHPSATAPSAAT